MVLSAQVSAPALQASEALAADAVGRSRLHTYRYLVLGSGKTNFVPALIRARIRDGVRRFPQAQESQYLFDYRRGQEEAVPVEPVDLQHFPLAIEMNRRRIVRERGPNLRGEFEYACFREGGQH
jgi:hypothetical protein